MGCFFMDISTTQEQKVRQTAYKIVGKRTLKKTLPLVDRLMDFVVKGRFTEKKLERNVELTSTALLAVWLLRKGVKRQSRTFLNQGIIVGLALGTTLAILVNHERKSDLIKS